MEKLWTGMTAVVTCGGIGAAIATTGAREGGAVRLLDIGGAADDVAQRIRAAGGQATAPRLDVTDSTELDAAVRTILDTGGGVDILVNCASRNSSADALSLTDDQWQEVFDLDVTAAWHLTRALLPRMLDAGSGVVINVGSLHATTTAEQAFSLRAGEGRPGRDDPFDRARLRASRHPGGHRHSRLDPERRGGV